MYEYKFVKVNLRGLKMEPVVPFEDTVNEYAAEGWRLIQVLTPPVAGYGTISYYEFVFERKFITTN